MEIQSFCSLINILTLEITLEIGATFSGRIAEKDQAVEKRQEFLTDPGILTEQVT